jgi:hypothetical protein
MNKKIKLRPIEIIALIVIFPGFFFVKGSITGYTIYEGGESFNLDFNSNTNYLWSPNQQGTIDTILLKGYLEADSSLIYLEDNLLYNYSYDQQKADTIGNLSEDINLNFEYGDHENYDDNNNGHTYKDNIIDYKINANFNFEVNYSKICTKYTVIELEENLSENICYGNEECCSFLNLESLEENWNETFYISKGKHGSTYNNKIRAQVIYYDLSLTQEDIHSYIYNSEIKQLNAIFTDRVYFNKNLTNLNLKKEFYTFNISIDGLLHLSNINYSLINITLANYTKNESIKQYKATIGEPVKWKKTIIINTTNETNISISNLTLELPSLAENISVKKKDLEGQIEYLDAEISQEDNITEKDVIAITGMVIAERQTSEKVTENITVGIKENITQEDEVIVEYYTEAPYAEELVTSNKSKEITIIGPEEVHYKDILAFTYLPTETNNLNNVKLYWHTNQTKKEIIFAAFDTNNNSKYDYIEWVVPSLSNQSYEIILITRADHLDENKTYIKDIYNYVKAKDNNFTLIPKNNYIRITFETNLTKDRDITVYAKSNNGSIEVYEENSNELITTFPLINQYQKYKVYLTNLNSSQDTFDLKVINSEIEFDYIIDPFGTGGNISFVNPTPSNASSQTATNVEINVSISEVNVSEIIYNWNGTNYTTYNDSLVVMFNFDNITSIGENSTHVIDLSRYGNNGTIHSLDHNVTGGKHDKGFIFDGSRGNITISNEHNFDFEKTDAFSGCFWVNFDTFAGDKVHTPLSKLLGTGAVPGWELHTWDNSGTVGDAISLYLIENWGNNQCIFASAENILSGTEGIWQHICFTYDGSNTASGVKIYQDSVSKTVVDSSVWCTTPPPGSILNNVPLLVGERELSGNTLDGNIDEIKIWNRSLNASEVYQDYISHLKKVNSTQWYIYVNQSLNTTNGLENETYTYQVFAIDNSNNSNSTEQRTITIGVVGPTWSNNKTNLTVNTLSGNLTYFNITLSDSDPANYTFSWYNGSTWLNDSNGTYTNNQELEETRTINIDIGEIKWTWYFNDTSGNQNQTDTWRVNIKDKTYPTINFTNSTPENNTLTNTPYVYVNITSSDNQNHSVFVDWNNSLRGWWSFESLSQDGIVYDNSTYANNGTMYNFTSNTTTTGIRGDAIVFDGVDDYIDAGNDSSFNISNEITLEAWIKSNSEGYVIVKDPINDTNSTCKTLYDDGSTTTGTYNLSVDGVKFEAYCNQNHSDYGGGWTLFATTDSTRCAEGLPLGYNNLTDLSTVYATRNVGNLSHTQWMLELYDNNVLKFSVLMNYSTKKQLDNRIANLITTGEEVVWNVTFNSTEFSGTTDPYRFSTDATSLTAASFYTRTLFSNDDGSWGVVTGNGLNGGAAGPTLSTSGNTPKFGQENPNTGDAACNKYYHDTGSTTSSNILMHIYIRESEISSAKNTPYALSTINGGQFLIINNTGTYNTTAEANINDGNWHHLAATYNGSDAKIYVDGVLNVTNTNYSGDLPNNDYALWIGRHYDASKTTNFFNGTMDEVKIYSRALSAEEINASYDAGTYQYQNNFTNLITENYTYKAYTIDSSGNVNNTEIRTIKVDRVAPIWSNNKTNLSLTTTSGGTVYFNITLNDSNSDSYIFSWYNGSVWANDSAVSYTNGQEIEIAKKINSSPINWTWYFNDTIGNTNQTDVWGVFINASLTISTIYPTGNISVSQNELFNVTVNVTCTSAVPCTGVNVTLDPSGTPVSCKEILDSDASSTDGEYTIYPHRNATSYQVYCDMTTDNGGWTLVGSVYANTMDDKAVSYHSNLTTLIPSDTSTSAQGIWDGMRNVSNTTVAHGNSTDDIRFSCKAQVNDATFTTDLAFYDIHWYYELTSSTSDGSVCFEEGNGAGDTQPTPKRTDLLTNTTKELNDQYASTYLEGEDACSSTDDFTIDLDNRGMDSSSSTDWGEDDNSKLCGSTSRTTGAWFVWFREGTNYTTSSKGGLINTTPGATPFYTNTTNPYNLSLTAGESQTITFWVNATGDGNNDHEFFAYANQTARTSTSAITDKWNVTIIDNTTPTVNFASPTLENGSYSQNYIEVNVTSSDTHISTIVNYLHNSTENLNGSSSGTSSPYYANFSSLDDGVYYINATVTDSADNTNSTVTRKITLDTTPPKTSYTSPTGINNTRQSENSTVINISITEEDLNEVIYNWNGTNYTMYNDSLILMMNFDNITEIGENYNNSIENKTVDLSKYGNNGTLVGPKWNKTGKYKGAFQFDGTDDYIDSGNDTSLQITSSFAISLWVYIDSYSGGDTVLVGKTDSGSQHNYYLDIEDDGQLFLGFYNGSSWQSSGLNSGTTVGTNSWNHVAGIFDDSTNTITTYINGVQNTQSVSITSSPYSTASSDDGLRLGNQIGSSIYFNGSIDEIRIWNKSLSADEIYQQYISNLNKFNSTQWYLQINQTQNASYGLEEENYTYNAFASDNLSNWNNSIERLIIIDWTAPIFNDLTNYSLEHHFPLVYDINASDQNSISCFTVNDTTNFKINCSGYLENNTKLNNEIYWLNITINDTANNINTSLIKINITDTTPPNFTGISNQTIEYGTVFVHNINASDSNNVSCFTVNDTTNFKINCSGYLENNTYLSIDQYWLNISINDTVNNNNSKIIWVNVSDTYVPAINITSPDNSSYTNNTGVNINYSVSDLNLDSCWYSNDTMGVNTTLASCINITTITWTEAPHNITIWANDSYGNINSSSIAFTVDLNKPTFTNLANQTGFEEDSFGRNINATDSSGVSCFTVNDTTNFKINCSGYLENNTLLNQSKVMLHWLNITINDSAGNENSSLMSVNITDKGRIKLDLITPTGDINASQNETFLVTVSVTCEEGDCGEVNVSLDPATDRTIRTCSGVWGASCIGSDPTTSDYSYDSCAAGSYYSTGFWVDEVFVDATTIAIGDTLNITCDFDCYSSSNLNDIAIMYYNGTWNKIWRQDSSCVDGNYSALVNISGNLGEQYARCSIGYNNYPNDAADDTCFDTTYSDNDDVNFTVIAAGKGGLVSTTEGDTPFYTNMTNPYNITLNKDESATLTWNVNATGTINDTHEFFVYANRTSDMGISNITSRWNVTIANATTGPTVTINYPLNTNYTSNVNELNYTVTSTNELDKCWYSNNSGLWNSTPIAAETNFTNVNSVEGYNNWTVYCNDTTTTESNSIYFYQDTILPVFDGVPLDRTIEFWTENLTEDFNATDASNLTFGVNDTTNFIISSDGILTNATNLSIGTYILNITVNDTPTSFNSTRYNVTVKDTIVPVINTHPNTTLEFWTENLTADFNATDNSDVVYGVNDSGSNFTIDANGILTNATNLSIGTYILNITINDSEGNSNSSWLNITVKDTNNPVLTGIPPNKTIEFWTENLTENFNATDLDTIIFGVNDTTNFIINEEGILTNATNLSLGGYILNITINDSSGNFNSTWYNVTISDTISPVIISSPNTTLEFATQNLTADFNATDLDTITFGVNDTTNFIINEEGILTNATNLSIGTYILNITINDSSGNSNSSWLNITVKDTIVPTINIPSNTTLEFWTENLTADFNATDANSLVYGVNDSGSNFTIDENGILTNATNLSIGIYILNITINDSEGNSNSSWLNITVKDTIAPIINIPPNATLEISSENLTADFNATDSSNLVYGVNDSGSNFTIDENGILTNATNLSIGTYILNITINDSSGNSNSTLFIVNISDSLSVNLNSPNNEFSNITEDSLNITFNCSASDGIGLKNISLYLTDNQNENFVINQTTELTGTANSTDWTLNLTIGNYTWNCLAYDNSGSSKWGTNYTILINLTDLDKDGIKDSEDKLEGNESHVRKEGISKLNVTVSGNSTQGSYNNTQAILFYDDNDVIINFTHNFSVSELDLRNTNIIKSTNSMIINLSGQVQTEFNKTIYIEDNSFTALCAKDDEINSITEISTDCDGANETDFTSCLGSTNKTTIERLSCTDEGTRIKIENLRYSAIRGTSAINDSAAGGAGSGGAGSKNNSEEILLEEIEELECTKNEDCESNEYCQNNECYRAECFEDSECNEDESCWDYSCIKWFDVEIIEFESPIKVGEFFDFTYFLKGMADINADVEIEFWVEKEGDVITSGQDTIYFGSFEEKTKTKELFLPEDVSSGTYKFYVEVRYGSYSARSYRTIGIKVDENFATIRTSGSAIGDYFVKNGYSMILIGIIIILTLFATYYIGDLKIRKEKILLEKFTKIKITPKEQKNSKIWKNLKVMLTKTRIRVKTPYIVHKATYGCVYWYYRLFNMKKEVITEITRERRLKAREKSIKAQEKRKIRREFLHHYFGLFKTPYELEQIAKVKRVKINEKNRIKREFLHKYFGLFKTKAELAKIAKKREERQARKRYRLLFFHDYFGLFKSTKEIEEIEELRKLKKDKKERRKARKLETREARKRHRIKFFHDYFGLFKTPEELKKIEKERDLKKEKKTRLINEAKARKEERIKNRVNFLHYYFGLFKTPEELKNIEKIRDLKAAKKKKGEEQKIKEKERIIQEKKKIILEAEKRKEERRKRFIKFLHNNLGLFRTKEEIRNIQREKSLKIARKIKAIELKEQTKKRQEEKRIRKKEREIKDKEEKRKDKEERKIRKEEDKKQQQLTQSKIRQFKKESKEEARKNKILEREKRVAARKLRKIQERERIERERRSIEEKARQKELERLRGIKKKQKEQKLRKGDSKFSEEKNKEELEKRIEKEKINVLNEKIKSYERKRQEEQKTIEKRMIEKEKERKKNEREKNKERVRKIKEKYSKSKNKELKKMLKIKEREKKINLKKKLELLKSPSLKEEIIRRKIERIKLIDAKKKQIKKEKERKLEEEERRVRNKQREKELEIERKRQGKREEKRIKKKLETEKEKRIRKRLKEWENKRK